jgi:ATP-binding cassette subfamily F protein 3
LIQALQQYLGSFVVVSHNRHFVTQIANKIWYIEDKQIKQYPGTFDEYEYWRKKIEAAAVKEETPKAKKKAEEKTVQTPNTPSDQARLKTLTKELTKLETDIAALEQKKSILENDMASPEVFNDFSKLQTIQAAFKKTDQELKAMTEKWEETAMAIDALEKK